MVIPGVFLACFCSVAALMAAGPEPTEEPSSQIFGTGTTAVVVDVIVRDRNGEAVTDLRTEDLELREAANRGTTGFERSVVLPLDATRVDVIAHDALAERASVRQFEVAGARR